MGFDLLWGNDIVSQSYKTPETIAEDNVRLANYNSEIESNKTPLSILKTYNNQDGEFEAIDRYPGQLGRDGALFKWFKYKFLPGGKMAQRPMLYIDGDESFTERGIESVIGSEIAMKRNCDEEFFKKFDAYTEVREGREVFDKNIILPCDYQIMSEYKYNGNDFEEERLCEPLSEITMCKLMPSEFKIYLMNRV